MIRGLTLAQSRKMLHGYPHAQLQKSIYFRARVPREGWFGICVCEQRLLCAILPNGEWV
jgi:hypothetical protein